MKCEHPVQRTPKNVGLCRGVAKWYVDGSAVCTHHKNYSLRRLYAVRLVPGWTPPTVERIVGEL